MKNKVLGFIFLGITTFLPGISLPAQSLLDKRIDALVGSMTTQEKINQLINNSFGGTPSNPRLGISGFIMDDGPHGVRLVPDRNGRTATSFPTGIAIASAWDEEIARKVGEAMGMEFWAFNRNVQLGPCVDICRDPRGGRSAESGGEDPYLSGKIGTAVAVGIQLNPVISTLKHFMGESKQSNRFHMDVLCSDRWLMDFSGYNFRTVMQNAGVLSVMGAYNLINGDKCCENDQLLNEILRKRWGYPFLVVSDWDAIFDSRKAIKAGTDICMGSNKYATDLPAMVARGEVSIADLDKAVRNELRSKILLGLTDFFPRGNDSFSKTPAINKVNLLAAQKSIILLKNEKMRNGKTLLPLSKNKLKIAVIGPNAKAENLNCFGSSETFPPYAVSILSGVKNKIGTENVTYAYGCDINSGSTRDFSQALEIAGKADVVIFAGGLDDKQEGEGFNYGMDRQSGSIALPGQQQNLINELAHVNPNIIAVIQSGGVCALHDCLPNIRSLIYSFYAGQEAGTAIADVLFGDYNPGGKMPVTMPEKDSDLPSWNEDTFRKFTQNLDGGYRWYDEQKIRPEFAFGSGLSYTTFKYQNLIVPEKIKAGEPFKITVDVTNTGGISGEEVAQLYLFCPSKTEIWMPQKQLRGFKRIALMPGETKTVTFNLSAEDFYYWNGNQYETQTGKFIFKVGGASDKPALSKEITIRQEAKKPDLKITQVYTMPRYPLAGQKVSFYALVKNQGNATASTACNIDFSIDRQKVASSGNVVSNLAPGQVKLISSEGEWTTSNISKSVLQADVSMIDGNNEEWTIDNNSFSRSFEVFDPKLDPAISNLAYHKRIQASSECGNNPVSSLVDGDYTSRWESGSSDNESLIIDLSLISSLKDISVFWEAAYAKKYDVEYSLDGINWTLLKSITNGHGGTEVSSFNQEKARFIRLKLLERVPIEGKKYGFSIYELVVNGNVIQEFPTIELLPVESQLYLPYAKTILNASLSGNTLKPEKLTYKWKQISGPVQAAITDPECAVTMVSFSSPGTYKFNIQVGNDAGETTREFDIYVSDVNPETDLSFMKPTSCSGVESTFTSPDMAVDGDGKTRWSSGFKNGEWWQVDLQHQVIPASLKIDWEGAYAKSFNVQISTDNKVWQTLYSTNSFVGGTSQINNNQKLSGRYLRVNCLERATTYGSSFYTFSTRGFFSKSDNHIPVAHACYKITSKNEIVLSGLESTDADKDSLSFRWEQIAGPNDVEISGKTTSQSVVTGFKTGDYFLKLTVDDGKDVDYTVMKIHCN